MSTAPPPRMPRTRTRPGARPLRPAEPVRLDETTAYAGLITRTVAFVLDALIINGLVAIATGAFAIVASVLFSDPSLNPSGIAAGAAAWALWSVGYFVVGWSVGGQTIGDAVMGIRVVSARDGRPLRPCRAIARFVALSLGTIPLLAGLWILLWDRQRRAFHDRVVRSVVVRVPPVDRASVPLRPGRGSSAGTGDRSTRLGA